MKIALLNIQYYPYIEGGAEISTQKLAEELAKTNEVYVICHGGKKSKEIHNNVHIFRMPARKKNQSKIERGLTTHFKVQCYKNLEEIFCEIRPDVLHTNNLHEFSVIVWKVANALKIPIVHTIRDYSLLDTKYQFERKIIEFCSGYVATVTAPSKFTLTYFCERGLFKKANKFAVANAIDFDLEIVKKTIEKKKQIPETMPVRFAFIGRYTPEKGIDWLISNFINLRFDAELHLFGKGILSENSTNAINNKKNIFEHGFLNECELENNLENIDVIVVPSLWDEPFGRTILDGYKSGCPVIITKRGGMPEVVDELKTGIIMADESDESLIAALTYFSDRKNILKMLPELCEKLRQYSITKQSETFFNIYKSLVK